jgi:hypothetical protein
LYKREPTFTFSHHLNITTNDFKNHIIKESQHFSVIAETRPAFLKPSDEEVTLAWLTSSRLPELLPHETQFL